METELLSSQHLNRTLIGSVLFVDIVNYSERTVPDQIAMKELFIVLLVEAVKNVATSEKIMVDTGDGAGIAFLGDPEDALFAALSLRDAIDAGEATIGEPGFIRMGINLGPLKVVRDINGHINMIGDGVNDAQRVMDFAEPGQLMVSNSYYDMISCFSRDYSRLFLYEGKRRDKHAREHEVYRFGPSEGSELLTEKLRDRSRARQQFVDTIPGIQYKDSAPANAPMTPTPVPPAARPLPRSTSSRVGLVATVIGVVAITGAVWSWTNTTEAQPAPTASAASSDASLQSSGVTAPEGPRQIARAPEKEVAEKGENSAAPTASASAAPTGTASSPSKSKTPVTAGKPLKPATSAASVATKADAKLAGNSGQSAEKNARKNANILPGQKPGNVILAIRPWGEIYVDGRKRGVSPPMKAISLRPGKHRIEIRNSVFASYKEAIDVKSGAETTVHYAF